jgi:hypothetical protein
MPCAKCNESQSDKRIVLEAALTHVATERAPQEVVKARRDVCRACEHSEKRKRIDGEIGLTTRSVCAACQCPIAGKTAAMDGRCPEGKW